MSKGMPLVYSLIFNKLFVKVVFAMYDYGTADDRYRLENL